MFGEGKLNEQEEEQLRQLLYDFFDPSQNTEQQIEQDFRTLRTIGGEVRAIAHQSLLLQGERIKRGQTVLKKYQEGAFTQWLVSTYGNRRTPYSYLQYYEFYQLLPSLALKQKMESMPRQAAYALASRPGRVEEKSEIIEAYTGQPQRELIALIQEKFPTDVDDQRSKRPEYRATLQAISRLCDQLPEGNALLTNADKERVLKLIQRLQRIL